MENFEFRGWDVFPTRVSGPRSGVGCWWRLHFWFGRFWARRGAAHLRVEKEFDFGASAGAQIEAKSKT
jgi:hypothetical protein